MQISRKVKATEVFMSGVKNLPKLGNRIQTNSQPQFNTNYFGELHYSPPEFWAVQ